MKVIWKEVIIGLGFEELPEGAEVLSVHEQHGEICLWFLCDPTKPKVPRKFVVVPTGEKREITGKYVGTVHMMGGHLVLHVFEEPYAPN